MIKTTVGVMEGLSVVKAEALEKSISRYFLLSMLAGIYVGLGIILIFSVGGPLHAAGVPVLKLVMGASFGVALTLVIFAGSELFTGNNMIMTIGSLSNKVSWGKTWAVWGVSYLGNLAGALLLAYGMSLSGLIDQGPVQDLLLTVTAAKMSAPFMQLLIRGILCNVLVCLAVWMSAAVKNETAKLILIFWCLFAFIGSGFEHSVANMTLLGMGVFENTSMTAIGWAGYVKNLVPVTIGNVIGGAVFVGAAYWYAAKGKEEAEGDSQDISQERVKVLSV